MSRVFPSFASAPACTRSAAVALSLAVWMPASAGAQPAPPATRPTVIQSVDAAPLAGGAGSGITVHANGPLPIPSVGVLDGPPRIYLDFAGVRLPSGITAEFQDPLLRGVRLAQHAVDPLVARIVLDLVAPIGHRIDSSERQGGKVVVLLGDQGPAPATVAAQEAPRRRTDAEKYLARILPILARLHELRSDCRSNRWPGGQRIAGPDCRRRRARYPWTGARRHGGARVARHDPRPADAVLRARVARHRHATRHGCGWRCCRCPECRFRRRRRADRARPRVS